MVRYINKMMATDESVCEQIFLRLYVGVYAVGGLSTAKGIVSEICWTQPLETFHVFDFLFKVVNVGCRVVL